jgi:N-acetylneuraminic acid mutarotase
VEVYDPIADKWTSIAPLPQPLDHTTAASYDGKLYVVGGGYLSRDALSNKLFLYDPTTAMLHNSSVCMWRCFLKLFSGNKCVI